MNNQAYNSAPEYQPVQPAPQPIYITQPVIMNAPLVLGTNPSPCNCPNCHGQIVTRLFHVNGTGTWLIAGGLCLLGCWLGCCLLPFCIDACKDVKHFCPNCNSYLGVKRMM